MVLQISNKDARRVILGLQGLADQPHIAFKKDGLLNLILRLGYVQVDSIQWVERAQHMILHARNQTYRPHHLKNLLENDRTLFENWTHDASVIPSQFYPYWRHKFVREKQKIIRQFTNWQGDGYVVHCEELIKKISSDGPLRSRDLVPQKSAPREMWQWHDGKAALEFLWRTGELCICGREGFQKKYDLAEKGVCADHFSNRVTHDEFVDWACRAALDRLGFGSAGDIARYWDIVTISEVNEWLASQGNDAVVPVQVEGNDKADHKQIHARADISSVLENQIDPPKRMRVLSPFDPVIRDRKRLSWLFGFDYRIEIYVPEAKRKWGYYVFPLLESDRVVGRIDMRALRRDQILEVKKVWFEPGIKPSKARLARLDAELVRQARLANVKDVVWLDHALQF